jgi:hypothetical protein
MELTQLQAALEPKYELSGFSYGGDSDELFSLGYTEEELLGIAYFASIRRRVVVNNKTFLCAVDGSHRAGKTINTCAAATFIDPTFYKDMAHRFIYEPEQLSNGINYLQKKGIRGGVYIVDEAGATIAAGDWYEDFSKAISEMFQIIGYLNPIVFFIAPIRDFQLSSIRKMQHAYWKFSRPNNEYTYLKPYELSYSSTYKKTFNTRPIVMMNGVQKHIERIKMTMPPKELTHDYDLIEIPRKDALRKGFDERIRQGKAREVKIKKDPEAIIKFVVENYSTNPSYQNKRSEAEAVSLDMEYLRYKFDLPTSIAKGIKKDAETQIQHALQIERLKNPLPAPAPAPMEAPKKAKVKKE